jgi:hypothetical protein
VLALANEAQMRAEAKNWRKIWRCLTGRLSRMTRCPSPSARSPSTMSPFIHTWLKGFLDPVRDFGVAAVIHDDAATDGTTKILRDYAARSASAADQGP